MAEDEIFLRDVAAELARARAKFPGDNVTLAALVEEVGELATASFEESADAVRKEAVQVAVMAARMVLDGDATLRAWRMIRHLGPLTNGERPRGIDMIAAERHRQIAEEGWTADHDAQHRNGELAAAAAVYALMSSRAISPEEMMGGLLDQLWPFEGGWLKPRGPLPNLIRAGALIAAEIDRRIAAGEALPEDRTDD